MVSAVCTHPCRQPSYTKQRQVLAEEEKEEDWPGQLMVLLKELVIWPTSVRYVFVWLSSV